MGEVGSKSVDGTPKEKEEEEENERKHLGRLVSKTHHIHTILTRYQPLQPESSMFHGMILTAVTVVVVEAKGTSATTTTMLMSPSHDHHDHRLILLFHHGLPLSILDVTQFDTLKLFKQVLCCRFPNLTVMESIGKWFFTGQTFGLFALNIDVLD